MATKKKTKKSPKKRINIEQLQKEITELRYGMKMMIDLIESLQKTVDQLRPSIFKIGQIPDDHVKYEQFRLNQKQIIPCQHRYPQVWMGVGPAPCELCGQLGPEPMKVSLQTIGYIDTNDGVCFGVDPKFVTKISS